MSYKIMALGQYEVRQSFSVYQVEPFTVDQSLTTFDLSEDFEVEGGVVG